MTAEISLEKLLAASENPAQSESIMGMMNNAVEFMKKVDSIVSMLQKWGVSPQIVEKIAIKYGELDKVPALPEQKQTIINGIVAKTELHKQLFEALNQLDEEQLKKQIEAQQKIQEKDAGRKSETRTDKHR